MRECGEGNGDKVQSLRNQHIMDADFEIVSSQSIVPSPPSPDELARGDYWSLLKRKEGYVLEYISGEMSGRLKQLVVSEEEGKHVIQEEESVEQVLLAHGVG